MRPKMLSHDISWVRVFAVTCMSHIPSLGVVYGVA